MANDFLFELGCEELPSGSVLPLVQSLSSALLAGLNHAKISYEEAKVFATPRRLAVLLTEVAEEQPNQTTLRRGPALNAAYDSQGQPTPALLGFAKSCQAEVAELTVSDTDKGSWVVFEVEIIGAKTAKLLPGIVSQALASLPIAKPMRWGDGDVEFARPLHWAVMILGNEVLDSQVLGLRAGRCTYGHRFHAPDAITLNTPSEYEMALKKAYVVADFAKRRTLVLEGVQRLAEEKDAFAIMPASLVDEVTSIVEWPEPLLASFEKEFLDIPSEALIASMQSHQKCFALQDKQGQLLPYFVTVSNLKSTHPRQVVLGNEKVMRARLSDAAFFNHQDKKKPLHQLILATGQVVFQARLGTLLDKSMRIKVLMQKLSSFLNLDVQHAARASELCKCDLMTGMVGEFPELQGLMGLYYAKHDGEAPEVAEALYEQYLPRFSGDMLPSTALGMALSLADRIDTMVGIFAIGQKPGGDKDPFKLRRHALAVVRMLIATSSELPLSSLISASIESYGEVCKDSAFDSALLHAFIMERLLSYYQTEGITQDIVHAAKARQKDWLYDLDKRIHALTQFMKYPEATALVAACKRVNNLLQHGQMFVEKAQSVDEKLLQDEAEKSLFMTIKNAENSFEALYNSGEYNKILEKQARLHDPVYAFFDKVMVMVDDESLKINRLALLARLQRLLQGVADISLLQITS